MPPPLPTPSEPLQTKNKIDEEEAKLIGAFLTTIGRELNSANDSLRADSLSSASIRNASDYYKITDARAEYRMSVTIGKNKEGAGKERQSVVVMNANYERVHSPGLDQAPFNVLFGVISASEAKREEILFILNKNQISTISKSCPIFSLGEDRFWVVDAGKSIHYMVELSSGGRVVKLDTFDKFNEHTAGMFMFLQEHLGKTYRRE